MTEHQTENNRFDPRGDDSVHAFQRAGTKGSSLVIGEGKNRTEMTIRGTWLAIDTDHVIDVKD